MSHNPEFFSYIPNATKEQEKLLPSFIELLAFDVRCHLKSTIELNFGPRGWVIILLIHGWPERTERKKATNHFQFHSINPGLAEICC